MKIINIDTKIVDDFPVQENKNYINISIKDNGTGISEEQIDKVFEPFFTTKHDCVRFGLVIAKFITQNHGSYIGVETKMFS